MYKINIILSQKFKYLNEGLQTFVYVSEDEKYILKTFKNLLQSKEQFEKWGLNSDDINEGFVKNSETSYKLAFEKLRKETALLYIHTADEPLPIKYIILDDKEYSAHDIHFIVQERVELVRDRIKKLVSDGKTVEVKKVIDDVIGLIICIWKKDITEDTFNWDHNYGYTESGDLVQIDVGSFYEGKKYLREEFDLKKLSDSVSTRWLEKNFPQFKDYYVQKVEKLYKEFVV